MKLLFDEHLSPKLNARLEDLFPGSANVLDLDLFAREDKEIWEYARLHNYSIISKDFDFYQRAFEFGHPPKVIYLTLGNCSNRDVEALLRTQYKNILEFFENEARSLLVL
jgi:predicted nuclease of predicted toxin-antitoxin system